MQVHPWQCTENAPVATRADADGARGQTSSLHSHYRSSASTTVRDGIVVRKIRRREPLGRWSASCLNAAIRTGDTERTAVRIGGIVKSGAMNRCCATRPSMTLVAGPRAPPEKFPAEHPRTCALLRAASRQSWSPTTFQERRNLPETRSGVGSRRSQDRVAGRPLRPGDRRVVLLQGLDVQRLVLEGADGADRGRRAGQGGDAGHAQHRGDAAEGTVVEERLAAEGRVDDEIDLPIQQPVADVGPALVDLVDEGGVEAVRPQVGGGAARGQQREPRARRGPAQSAGRWPCPRC